MTPAEAGALRHAIEQLLNRQRQFTLQRKSLTSYPARDATTRKLKRAKIEVRQMIDALTDKEPTQ